MERNKGITLIALVITVIILIILAGITISLLIGDNGLITKAKEGKVNMQMARQEEQEYLDSLYGDILNVENNNEYVEKYVNGVPIPKGFYYVGGTAQQGLVISDAPEDEEEGTDHEVAKTLVGNQFVWIPVSKTEYKDMFYDSSISTVGSVTSRARIIRRGKLYSFDSNGKANFIEDCLTTDTGYREPAYVTGDSTQMQTSIDEGFANMKSCVGRYEGFYVGRYEASLSADGTKSESKYKMPMTSAETSGNKWSGIYEKLTNLNTTSRAVDTHMIWGCQWDRVMKFVNGSLDGNGNVYNVGTLNIERHGGMSLAKTGDNVADKVKNIYDLEGNLWEWTMEAKDADRRVARSCIYYYQAEAASRNAMTSADFVQDTCGSRQVLYIKVPGNITDSETETRPPVEGM